MQEWHEGTEISDFLHKRNFFQVSRFRYNVNFFTDRLILIEIGRVLNADWGNISFTRNRQDHVLTCHFTEKPQSKGYILHYYYIPCNRNRLVDLSDNYLPYSSALHYMGWYVCINLWLVGCRLHQVHLFKVTSDNCTFQKSEDLVQRIYYIYGVMY